jgi:PAS domain-containing protein
VLEAALVGACTVAVGLFVFDKTPAGPSSSPALLYAPIPLLIWAALRFGLGGISVSVLIIAFQAIWGTMRGHGPFLAQTPIENALALQSFLLVTATPLMLLAVVIDEERRSKESLRGSANLMGLAAEAGDLAMWVWDVSGNDVWMTERGRSLFGLSPEGRLDFAATFDRVHPEDRSVGFMGAVVGWILTTERDRSFSACRWTSRPGNRRRRQPRRSARNWSTSHAWPPSASSPQP